jgi:hypothetical protein
MRDLARQSGSLTTVLLLVCCLSLNVLASDQPTRYDGQWWLSISERQRVGYVRGFSICYLELVDRTAFDGGSLRLYSTSLTTDLQNHPESRSESAESILLKVNKLLPRQKSSSPPNETPEELAAKWGANNDGDDWRGPDMFQLGYVQGFLDCYSKHTRLEYGTFSRTPKWYVDAIANWYGTGPDPEQLNPSREKTRIPEVLFRFHD